MQISTVGSCLQNLMNANLSTFLQPMFDARGWSLGCLRKNSRSVLGSIAPISACLNEARRTSQFIISSAWPSHWMLQRLIYLRHWGNYSLLILSFKTTHLKPIDSDVYMEVFSVWLIHHKASIDTYSPMNLDGSTFMIGIGVVP